MLQTGLHFDHAAAADITYCVHRILLINFGELHKNTAAAASIRGVKAGNSFKSCTAARKKIHNQGVFRKAGNFYQVFNQVDGLGIVEKAFFPQKLVQMMLGGAGAFNAVYYVFRNDFVFLRIEDFYAWNLIVFRLFSKINFIGGNQLLHFFAAYHPLALPDLSARRGKLIKIFVAGI